MIEGAIISAVSVLLGMGIGRFWPSRRKGPKPPKPVKPICGCTHHYSFHDPATGQCHASVKGNVIHWDDDTGWPDDWEIAPCACQKYAGPEPLPEYYAPEIGA